MYRGGRLGEQDIAHGHLLNPFQNGLDFREASAGDQVVPGDAEMVGGV